MASMTARSQWLSWGVFALSVSAFGLAAAAGASWLEVMLGGAVMGASAIVGLLLTLRRPSNPIGWLLAANGVLLPAFGLVSGYDTLALEDGAPFPGAMSWTVWFEQAGWVLLFTPLTAVVFVFPVGRLPSPRWRRVALAALVPPALILGVSLLSSAPFDSPYGSVDPPLPVMPGGVVSPLLGLGIVGMLASLVAAAAAARSRLRVARGAERLQLLWLVYAALGLPLALVVCVAGFLIGTEAPLIAALVLTMIAIPTSIGIAVLRHQLLDIELVLNRTLVYGALSVCIVACYAGIVAGLGALLGSDGAAGLIAAGLVAVGIQPLRVWLQSRVDRLVYGDRSDPYRALTRLTERVQATLAPAEVVDAIVTSVADALRLPYVAIELRHGEALEPAAHHGAPRSAPTTRIPLSYQGETIAQLAIQLPQGRELAPADLRLLEELARPAGVAVHAVRLTADLQRSRERLVSAREEERRRLRRDLHDGLGPMLAASVLQLDAAGRAVVDDPARARELLDGMRDQSQAAIADVRRLVDELRPPALDELGLVEALREQATRLGSDRSEWGSVQAPSPMPHLPAAVEVAAYRIAMEAMTNVVRHADAGHCRVRLSLNGNLLLEVEDDGHGLPAAHRIGVGLRSMRERAAELGGSCVVEARSGGGTLVRAQLPVEAP